MQPTIDELRSLPKKHEFFVGVDSDGCVFDTMETKQKECFCPAYIKHFGLQAASRYAREVWEFVNLYSKHRGLNRFLALQQCLIIIGGSRVFKARGVQAGPIPELDAWLASESNLSTPALQARAERTGSPALRLLLAWNNEVNARIDDMVHSVPPFGAVKECLARAHAQADTIIVSQTPYVALKREWDEHGMTGYTDFIAGQELGSKADHIRLATAGRYAADRMLMIGDAPGDRRAAESNRALFFPIVPGREDESWQRLRDEGLDRFFGGAYAGRYQAERVHEFESALPDAPPWTWR